jgi:hypothetical protein
MHFVLGECWENSAAAVKRCAGKYPYRLCADQLIDETGTERRVMVDAGHIRRVPTPVVEEDVLDVVVGDPSLSTRRVSERMGVSLCVAYRNLREQHCPYHEERAQTLIPADTCGCSISVPRISSS